jgi:uncharacterized membrane protein
MIQTVSYEIGGLCLSVPLVALIGGGTTGEALRLMLALAAADLAWSPIHDTIFDEIDQRRSGRLVSDRPQRGRLVHALSHEATTIVVTLPILIWIGGFGFWEALLADLGLALLYAVCANVFHPVYDRLRPVRPRVQLRHGPLRD